MTEKRLPFFLQSEELEKDLLKICKALGVSNSPKRALARIEKLKNDIVTVEQSEQQRIAEVCKLVGAGDWAAAKKRIVGLVNQDVRRKANSVASRFGFDTTFLTRMGESWDRQLPKGKDSIKIIEEFNRGIAKQQEILTETYNKFLQLTELRCISESFTEEQTYEECLRWHIAMEDDFDLLSFTEFWQKYYGSENGLDILPTEPATVLLYDSLPLVKKYAPIRIYQDLWDADPETYGYVSRHTAEKWSVRKTMADNEMREKERFAAMNHLMVEIFGLAAFRGMRGAEAHPEVIGIEGSSLMMLLGHEEINPYGKEQIVDDETSFMEFQQRMCAALEG